MKREIRQNKRRGFRPPFRIQFYYSGSTTPVTCVIRTKRYADYLVNRALNSELCTHVIYKDSLKQNVNFSRHVWPEKKTYPQDVTKFLKEQLNEQIEIRNRNSRAVKETCTTLFEEKEMQG